MIRARSTATLCLLGMVAGGAGAEEGAAELAEADRLAVIETVERLFEGMRTKDAALMRSLLAPEVTLLRLDQEGRRRESSGADGFIEGIVSTPGLVEEHIWDPEVRVDGPLGVLWAPYEFRLDGELSHCGHDLFQLVKQESGWRVVSVAWTVRTAGCPESPTQSD